MAIFILIVATLLAFVFIGILHHEEMDKGIREIGVVIAVLLGLPLFVLAWAMEICPRRGRD